MNIGWGRMPCLPCPALPYPTPTYPTHPYPPLPTPTNPPHPTLAYPTYNKSYIEIFDKVKRNGSSTQIGVQGQPIGNQRYPCYNIRGSSDRFGIMVTKRLDVSVFERNVLVLVTSATDQVVKGWESIGMA